jgi:uncharacterized repeat protein (TIGR01451 family)
MKKTLVLLVVLLLGVGGVVLPATSLAPVSAEEAVVTLDEAADGTPVDLRGDQTLVIDLEGNLSTGYVWEVAAADGAILQQVGQFEFKQYADIVGSAGRQILRFRAVGTGQTDLSLVYRRPWEDVAPLRDYAVQVRTAGPFEPYEDDDTTAEPPVARDLGPIGTSALPTAYEWCSAGGCTPVKNQGSCGSCWAFATSGVVESLIKLSDGVTRDLAEQYLVSCNTHGWGCPGGSRAFSYFIDTYLTAELAAGAVYESDYPYTSGGSGNTGTCTGSPHTKHEKLVTWGYVAGGEFPAVETIKQAIYDYGPVYVSVCAGPLWNTYSGGVFSTDESASCGGGNGTNHGVVLVGWDDSQGVWYLRNSWSPSWGESLNGAGGYMRIAYGTSNVGRYPAYAIYESNSDVSIEKAVIGSDFAPGDPVTFTLSIENSGEAIAAGVVVTDAIPAEVLTPTFASTLAITPTGTISYVWNVEPLLTGESGTITITGWIDPGLPGDFALVNRATISDPDDQSPDNNTSSALVGGTGVYLPLVMRGASTGGGLVNGSFEQGTTGWGEFSTHGWPLIINSGFPEGVSPHGGSWAVWLGGDYGDLSYISQQVTVPASQPYLAYYHWIGSEDFCGYDYGGVVVNGTDVDVYDLCEDNNTGGWAKHVVNLSAYAGQSVQLRIRATTDGSLNSNLFIDDVSFQASASSGPEGSPARIDPEAALPRLDVIAH